MGSVTICDQCGSRIASGQGVHLERGPDVQPTLGEEPGPWDFCSVTICLVAWAGGRRG